MKIKEIKLFGFKSFPGETKLILDQGITAFVGPNGSGKSNIFDALRWVFGEQSMKALRCERIEDLIYVSPDTKDDAHFTEVSVTIDNEDYFPQFGGEFEIKRKFYRSGESEFFLNRVKCRLQDIQALFLNSGTLTYSFLELSEIEKIIHGDTKEMFDDVSGILKYQERREQTKRRLESTEQDLLRLEDIIHEMQRSLRSLRRQVRQTKLYQELKEEYKLLTLFKLKKEYGDAVEKLAATQEKNNSVETKRQAVLQEIKELEKERELLKNKMQEIEERRKDTVAKITAVDNSIEELYNQITLEEEKANQIILANERTITSIKEKEGILNNNKMRLSKFDEKKAELRAEIEKAQAVMQEKQIQLDEVNKIFFSLADELKTIDDKILNCNTDTQNCQNEITKINFEIDNQEKILTRINEEHVLYHEDITAGKRAAHQIEEELENILEKQSELSTQLDKANDNLSNSSKKLTELETDMQQRQEALSEAKIAFDTLKQRIKDKDSQRKIADNFQERHQGLLRDGMAVTSGYESIVDICLGDMLNYHLIRNYDSDNFRDLPDGRYGFIDIAADYALSKGADIDDDTRPLTDFVDFKDAYNIIQRYIADYFVADNFAKAHELSKKNYGYGFVTKDGVLFRNGCIIIEKGEVGYFKVKQSLEKHKEEIETLNNEILFISEEKGRLISEQEELKNEIETEKNRLFTLNVKKSEHSLRLNELKHHIEKASKDYDAIRKDRSTAEKNIEELKQRIEDLDKRITGIDSIRQHTEEEKQMLLTKSHAIEQEMEQGNAKLNDCKIESAALVERLSSIDSGIDGLHSEISAVTADIDRLKQDKSAQSLDVVQTQIKALKQALKNKKEEKDEVEAQLPEKIAEDLTRKLNALFDTLSEKQREQEEIQNSIMQLKYESFQLGLRKDEVGKKAKDDFRVDLRDYTPDEDIEDADNRLIQVKGKLEKLGEVNPLSLELYENEKSRLDEFLKQRDDIITARRSLLKSIEELDSRARDRFIDIFEKVKKEFNYVFSNFFEGGQADLVLSDIENPLTSKVDIVVRMKGKRLKTINQLSGGERTLLAISLLLALYLVKPAPFCILDEIDAPLDDANVVRFNKFLRDLSQRTQVVIITHNRATMEYADYLYGLTMEKPGQSKVISARLADLEKINIDA